MNNQEKYQALIDNILSDLNRLGYSHFLNLVANGRLRTLTLVERSVLLSLSEHFVLGKDISSLSESSTIPLLSDRSGHGKPWSQGQVTQRTTAEMRKDAARIRGLFSPHFPPTDFSESSLEESGPPAPSPSDAPDNDTSSSIVSGSSGDRFPLGLQTDTDAGEASAEELSELKSTLWNTANTLKKEVRETTDAAMAEMKRMQSDLESALRLWQNDLYVREFYPIASCYIQLYQILTKNRFLTQRNAVPSEASEAVSQLSAALSAVLRNMEKGFRSLGLSVFSPSCGEPYDDVMHATANGEAQPADAVILRCVTPGIMRRVGDDNNEREPVIRATVEVEAGKEEAG